MLCAGIQTASGVTCSADAISMPAEQARQRWLLISLPDACHVRESERLVTTFESSLLHCLATAQVQDPARLTLCAPTIAGSSCTYASYLHVADGPVACRSMQAL